MSLRYEARRSGVLAVLYDTPIIAEVKIASPFDPDLSRDWDEQFENANEVGDILSIHVDSGWEGSLEDIDKATKLTDKPIMAKGINGTEAEVYAALEAGADLVLSVGLGMLTSKYLELCLIEPYSIKELMRIPPDVNAVWNSRDLISGGLKQEPFALARSLFPPPRRLFQASNVTQLADIESTADGVIIGTHLPDIRDELKAAA
jgi:indole-3-glycerol phosphate synthase